VVVPFLLYLAVALVVVGEEGDLNHHHPLALDSGVDMVVVAVVDSMRMIEEDDPSCLAIPHWDVVVVV